MDTKEKLKILFSSRDENLKRYIKTKILSEGHQAIECYSFLDVILHSDDKCDLFICDISYNLSYAELYLKLREDKRYFIPNTVFIAETKIDNVVCINKNELFDNCFEISKYTNIDNIIEFCKYERETFKKVFAYYGLSYRYEGTKYLEEILKITYFKPFPYLKKLGLCYDYLSIKYDLSCNAIEKKLKRAINYAKMMKGKGIIELCEKYDIECPTVKFLVGNILSKLRCCEF